MKRSDKAAKVAEKVLLLVLVVLGFAGVALADPYQPLPIFLPPPPPPPIIGDAWIRTDGQNLIFALFFTHQPDYAHETFQWFLSNDANELHPMIPARADFIVRSDDIANGNVKVCSAHPFGAGCPGGWGIDFGSIPTDWNGEFLELTFSVPITIFGDQTMSFDVMSLLDGAQNDVIHGTVEGQPVQIIQPIQNPVGVPEAPTLLMSGLAVLAMFLLGPLRVLLKRS